MFKQNVLIALILMAHLCYVNIKTIKYTLIKVESGKKDEKISQNNIRCLGLFKHNILI